MPRANGPITRGCGCHSVSRAPRSACASHGEKIRLSTSTAVLPSSPPLSLTLCSFYLTMYLSLIAFCIIPHLASPADSLASFRNKTFHERALGSAGEVLERTLTLSTRASFPGAALAFVAGPTRVVRRLLAPSLLSLLPFI